MSNPAPPVSIRHLVPLTFLALATLWYASKEDAPAPPKPGLGFAADVDYYLKGVSTQHYGPDGQLQYQLNAELAKHYRSNDAVKLDQPHIRYRLESNEQKTNYWDITARDGWFYNEKPPRMARLALQNDVQIMRNQASEAPIVTRTEEMWFLPHTGELRSQSPVTIKQGSHQITAKQLNINTKTDVITLRGNVQGAYFPAPVRSQSPRPNS